MIFQWYLFVFLFGLLIFSYFPGQSYKVRVAGQMQTRIGWLPFLLLIAVLTYTAATRDVNFGDTLAYKSMFLSSGSEFQDIRAALAAEIKDKGFSVFTILIKQLIGEHVEVYFGIIAAFCLLCVVGVYKKHSSDFFMSMFLFLASGEYVQWTHNGIRQFIAVAMIFAATDLLLKKKYVPYFAIVLFASTFHASALIMIPMCFVVQGPPWNNKTVLFILVVLAAVFSVDELTGAITTLMENTQYSNEVNQFLDTDGTNYLRVLVFCIPPIIALIFRKRLLRVDDPLANLATNMSIASMGTYIISMFTSGIFIGRLPIYFSLYNYMLLPWIIQRTFDKRSSKLIYLIVMGCYMVYYYYQMHVIWGL